MENLTGIPEFAQVSIIRYNGLVEHIHLLEMRMAELERYIADLEGLLLEGYREDPDRRFFTLDKEDVKKVMKLEGEE